MSTLEYASASAVKKVNMLCVGFKKLNCRRRRTRQTGRHAPRNSRRSAHLRVQVLSAGQAGEEALSVARHELSRQLDHVQVKCGDAVRQRNRVLLLRALRQRSAAQNSRSDRHRTFSGASRTTGLKFVAVCTATRSGAASASAAVALAA